MMICSVCGKSIPPPFPFGTPKRDICSLACDRKYRRLRKKAVRTTSDRGRPS